MKVCWLAFVILMSMPAIVHGVSYCDLIRNNNLIVGKERPYLLRLCKADISTHKGPIVSINGGFLPILEEFYFKVPNDHEIRMFSGRSPKIRSYEERAQWPYGVIWIRPYDRLEKDSIRLNEKSIASDALKSASEKCGIPISLRTYEKSDPKLEFSLIVYELRIGESIVVFGGGSQHLANVTGELYAAVNCK